MSAAGPIVVVGGGPAGLATARAYRAAGGGEPVTVLTAEPETPYERPPLTKEFLRGEVGRGDLPIEDADFFAREGIELRTDVSIERLDLDLRVLVSVGGERLPFGSCVLATGSEPVRLPVPGGEDPDVLLVRTVADSERLAAAARPEARLLVIGAGFIGSEAAVSVAMRGATVTQVTDEATPQAARLGEEMGAEIAAWLREAGVELRTGAPVEAIRRRNGGFEARLDGAEPVAADAVLCAVGVRARTELAEAAGLTIEQGAVVVDAHMRSSAAGVYAVGDVAFAANVTAGRGLRVEHWGDALAHGEAAGRSLAGEDAAWREAPGFWSVIGGRTLKYVAWGDGWDEVRVERDGAAFTAWYGSGGATVGVLTHEHDADYERGRELVERGAPLP